jgi:hypothetical protein
MSEDSKKRDSSYRIAALNAAIDRAGQDGGIEGGLDVLAIAAVYYQWLTGDENLKDPVLEMEK